MLNNNLNNLEIEIKKRKKQNEGFIFTSEDNDRKRTYLIYSLELKRRLRELAFPFGVISDKCQAEYGVENTKTRDKIVYQTGKEENPDKLVLISGKYSKAIADGNEELLKQQELEKQKKEKAEQKRIDGLWEKERQRLGISVSAKVTKCYWRGWDNDGKVACEGVCVQEVKNQPLIQEIPEEELKKIGRENITTKNFSFWQVIPPKS